MQLRYRYLYRSCKGASPKLFLVEFRMPERLGRMVPEDSDLRVSAALRCSATCTAARRRPCRPSRNVPNWVESNDEFHGVAIEASGNRRLRQTIRDLHLGFTRSVMLSALAIDGRRMRENVSQHEAILSAITRHDAIEARKEITHHILRSGKLIVWWLERQGRLR